MLSGADVLLSVIVAAPAVFALLVALLGGRHVRVLGYGGALIAGFGFAGAGALALQGSREGVVTAGSGTLLLAADRIGVVLLLLVFGVSSIVQAFAIRYLAGDRRANWFTAGASLLTAASAGLVSSATLLGLALSWSVAGMALCWLLAMYWHLPAARDGVRRTAIAFLVGDLALWAAVGTVTARHGTVELRALSAYGFDGPLPAVVGCLVVIAALSRSAQIPFHRWLPATLAAPTPVSALLHAGVVNAGGILLVRLAPMVSGEPARALTIVAGIITLAYGAVVMLVKPDVKGALAHSTMAQMGFMILTAGLGLWAATIFHLVAHGCYKATLFLSSGSAIAARRRAASHPATPLLTRSRRLLIVVTSVTLPALALYAAAQAVPLSGAQHGAEHALLIFAWASGAAATWGWLKRQGGISASIVAAAVLVPAAIGYLGLVTAVSKYLTPALPAVATSTALTWAAAATTVAILAALAVLRGWTGTALHRALYVHALSFGHITAPVARLKGARS